jgi:putative transposase
MRKARFTEHQIIAVIKSVEAGRTVKDVCREAGISEATYFHSSSAARSVISWRTAEM